MYGTNYYRYRGFPAPKRPKGVAPARLLHVRFFSPALRHRRSYLLYLPPGYSAAAAHGVRFPVLYFLHGSPGAPKVVFDAAKLGVDYEVLLHEHRIKPFLLVMPDGRNGSFRSDTEWADTRGGRYGSFVMDVVHAVDARWSTIPERRDRMIGGYSEGAYGALNLSLHHLSTFGSLESWSGYTRQSASSGPFAHEPPSVVAANEPYAYLPRVAAAVRRRGLRAYIYTGTKDPERWQVAAYARELRAAGAAVRFKLLRGGHDWRLWRDHAAGALIWASRVLAP